MPEKRMDGQHACDRLGKMSCGSILMLFENWKIAGMLMKDNFYGYVIEDVKKRLREDKTQHICFFSWNDISTPATQCFY